MISEGSIQIPFRFAAGKGGSRFLSALRDEQIILASPCPECGLVLCPARSFCAKCGAELVRTVEVGPKGKLQSWTRYPGKGAFGLILLEGADTALLHRLLDAPEQPLAGSLWQARFARERSGHISDLEGFHPVEEAVHDRPLRKAG